VIDINATIDIYDRSVIDYRQDTAASEEYYGCISFRMILRRLLMSLGSKFARLSMLVIL
jgi:hypothetical protein